ncbi:hypothetical protein CP533_5962 [Ophiocordyceps camponoti-saundersi (nom. inval.)]|nr:hypothetical protein CP533_5962 [Ophiocordyceps camponoti-saundersi (nom. inval.)]
MAAATIVIPQPLWIDRRESLDNGPSKRVKGQHNSEVNDETTDWKRKYEESQREYEELQRLLQNTTFKECLTAYHEHLYSMLPQIIERDPSKCNTEVGHTKVDDRVIPPCLSEWHDFLDRQDEIFELVEGIWREGERAFDNKSAIMSFAGQLKTKKISNEKSTAFVIEAALERPTKMMIDELIKKDDFRRQLNIPRGVEFRSDLTGVVGQARGIGNGISDQYCCHTAGSVIFLTEYKPPHKLKPASFDLMKPGLDIHKSIVKRKFVPEKERKAFRKEIDMAAAIVQTFKDMVHQGINYGVLTTGETIVFFHFDLKKNSHELFYHVADFSADAQTPENYRRTALGQFLAFTLMAARGEPGENFTQDSDDIRGMMDKMRKWREPKFKNEQPDKEQQDPQPQDSEPGSSQSSSESSTADPTYHPTEPVSPDNGERRTLRPRAQSSSCRREADEDSNCLSNGDDDDDDDDEQQSRKQVPGANFGGRQEGQQPESNENKDSDGGAGAASQGTNGQSRPYCTQQCLLGLVNGDQLDAKCPNVALHHETGRSVNSCHPINYDQFLELLRKQLKWSIVQGIKRAGRYAFGATGILFQITLLKYGYTLVFKGGEETAGGALQHERTVYRRLQPIQGKNVPVCLGMIDLRTAGGSMHWKSVEDGYSEIVHLLFLSWAGVTLSDAEIRGEARQEVEEKAKRSFRAMHELGVIQEDVRPDNMLVNDEVDGIMVIDFERATLLERPRNPLLVKAVRQKRSRKSHTTEGKRAKRHRSTNAGLFSGELSCVRYEIGEWISRNRELTEAEAA